MYLNAFATGLLSRTPLGGAYSAAPDPLAGFKGRAGMRGRKKGEGNEEIEKEREGGDSTIGTLPPCKNSCRRPRLRHKDLLFHNVPSQTTYVR